MCQLPHRTQPPLPDAPGSTQPPAGLPSMRSAELRSPLPLPHLPCRSLRQVAAGGGQPVGGGQGGALSSAGGMVCSGRAAALGAGAGLCAPAAAKLMTKAY